MDSSEKQKMALIKEVLLQLGISKRCFPLVFRSLNLDEIEMTEDGNPADMESVKDRILEIWSKYVPVQKVEEPEEERYTLEDVKKMSASEINENYAAIRLSLFGD
ncbi:MAG: hypothetical protein LUH03_10870 [Oscillospiraceae bacterium]|nr:hypothetical protein [Oscillospiraceae bacterium]